MTRWTYLARRRRRSLCPSRARPNNNHARRSYWSASVSPQSSVSCSLSSWTIWKGDKTWLETHNTHWHPKETSPHILQNSGSLCNFMTRLSFQYLESVILEVLPSPVDLSTGRILDRKMTQRSGGWRGAPTGSVHLAYGFGHAMLCEIEFINVCGE